MPKIKSSKVLYDKRKLIILGNLNLFIVCCPFVKESYQLLWATLSARLHHLPHIFLISARFWHVRHIKFKPVRSEETVNPGSMHLKTHCTQNLIKLRHRLIFISINKKTLQNFDRTHVECLSVKCSLPVQHGPWKKKPQKTKFAYNM